VTIAASGSAISFHVDKSSPIRPLPPNTIPELNRTTLTSRLIRTPTLMHQKRRSSAALPPEPAAPLFCCIAV